MIENPKRRVLINNQQLAIINFFLSRTADRRRGLAGCGPLVSGDFDVFEPILSRLCDYYIGGDGVAGLELIEGGGRLDGVGHDHWVHKTGDGLVVDVGGSSLLVDGDDFPLERIAPGCGLRVRGGLWGSAIAGRGERQQS
jgi:hypothetical protein